MARQTAIRAAVPAVALVLVAAACGGGDDDASTSGGDGAGTIRVANTSPTQPGFVPAKFGVITYGENFGLDMTIDNFTTFDSHAVATQTVLSGRADVVAGSLVSNLLLNEQGQDFKLFCPYIAQDDFVIAGANGISSVEDLFDANTRVALDSPGGAGDVILNAMLQALGQEQTAADIPGIQILESSGLRTTAFASGDVDATVIHDYQYYEAAEQATDPVIIASLFEEVPDFVKEAHAAPAAWLEENAELAANYCAAVLMGMRELSADYDAFVGAVEEFADVEEMPDDETLRALHTSAVDYGFWPGEDGGLSEESVTFMAEVGVKSGLLEEVPEYEDVVAVDVLERALELVEEQS
ncbi:ABC transporter substrate-binding protein [Jiangella alba]|uniref:NMT1/THI5 like n=1 Tax=Jiangella alba TaxID=561176 RepID=A0A1H5PPE1_9ACTN|nr:ABC transporter substrate-binding protein [Jiangella alba]SEF15690.1 NMT1/THI5 like [Jiangella alba]